jgi:alcohol dehydrogenase class IV
LLLVRSVFQIQQHPANVLLSDPVGEPDLDSFRHASPPLRLFAGDAALQSLEKELARRNCGRAIILCGRTLAKSTALDLVRKASGARYAGDCTAARAHSPRSAVEEAATRLAELGADAVIVVGGGSAMVTARAAAIALAEGKPLNQLCTQRDESGRMHSPRLDAPKLPIFAIPTTPTTAVDKSGTAIFDEERNERLALFDPKTRPAAIFLVPSLLMTAPNSLVRNAALNTLSSAIEGLGSGTPDRLAQAMLIHAIRLTAEQLSGEMTEDAEARLDLAQAAIMCARSTDHTGMGLATVISHAVAKVYDVDGGVAKAVALPYVLTFNQGHMKAGNALLAQALDCAPADISMATLQLFRALGLPQRLRDLGVPSDGLPEVADKCMRDWFIRSNPRPVRTHGEVLALLNEAW